MADGTEVWWRTSRMIAGNLTDGAHAPIVSLLHRRVLTCATGEIAEKMGYDRQGWVMKDMVAVSYSFLNHSLQGIQLP